MNEKPIERLNYYNGQRLEADDLKLEQEYHIRVRRWLNKSLYSAGIAHGLEVQRDNRNPQQVIVGPGLALDVEGREMILLDEERIMVVGQKSEKESEPEGNYLFIQYREETRAEETDYCAPSGNGHKHGQVAWGGPSRVRAEPILGWSSRFPHESSGKVVLAQVELDEKCNVKNVYHYPRHYIGPASNAMVRQYALEGERHIDADNPGRIYFHIRGRQPNAVTLFLRAEKFSTLYYTELGQHTHLATVTGSTGSADPELTVAKTKHQHGTGGQSTLSGSADDPDATPDQQTAKHNHDLRGREGYLGQSNLPGIPGSDHKGKGEGRAGFFLIERGWSIIAFQLPSNLPYAPVDNDTVYNILPEVNGEINGGGQHSHKITGETDFDSGFSYGHMHTVSGSGSTGSAGVDDVLARSEPDPNEEQEKAFTYIDDLQVYIGKIEVDGKRPDTGIDITDKILIQLRNLEPTIWKDTTDKFGDGTKDHPLAKNGTGPIRLDLLSNNVSFPEGHYFIDLVVPSGGGRVVYNLYVE